MSTGGNKYESRGRGSSRGRGTIGNGHTVRATNTTNTLLAQDISQEDKERILLA